MSFIETPERSFLFCLPDTGIEAQFMHHVYFMGIGGTAMGSVAILLKQKGYRVSGSDQNLYPPMSDRLREAGIEAWEGYDAAHLAIAAPDLVVVGNVIGRGNPEAEWLLEQRSLRFVSLPELIRSHLIGNRDAIVVSGTHGKTTTTALIQHLLQCSGVRPGHLIAGVPNAGFPSALDGDPDAPFVIEGDEYDSAFFDKRSKFIHYFPKLLLINNLEFDHADIFRDLEDVERSFRHLVRLVPGSGCILINGDDARLAEWVRSAAFSRVWTVGCGPDNDLRIKDFSEQADGSRFSLELCGRPWMEVAWSLAAVYNARNAAMAALATALQRNPQDPGSVEVSGFEAFEGVRRRQQIRLKRESLLVIEDFGHHPTAVKETLRSLKNRFPDHALWACFEPRSNTATMPVFEREWIASLSLSNRCWIGPVHRANLIPHERRLDTARVAESLVRDHGVGASAHTVLDDMESNLYARLDADSTPKLVVFFTNGSFGGLIDRVVARY